MWKWPCIFTVVLWAHSSVSQTNRPISGAGERRCKCVPYYTCPAGSSSNEDGSVSNKDGMRCESFLDVCCKSPVAVAPSHLAPSLVSKKGCGRRIPEGLERPFKGITNNDARFGEFPWVVAVMKVDPEKEMDSSRESESSDQCGGSLIHPKVVLTGAHCVAGKEAHQLKIRAGDWDILNNEESLDFQERDVGRIVAHEQFNGGNLFNDVALLILSKAVDAAENIGFVCLPNQGYVPPPETRCFATGWGKDVSESGSRTPGVLKKIDVPVIANTECQTALRDTVLGRHFKLHHSFMCAGGEQGRDACKGDGGSPLVCPIPGNPAVYIQSGIVAWGIGCGKNQTPGVYANVASFRNWIDEQIHKASLDSSYYSY